jgi:Methyltransferase domain
MRRELVERMKCPYCLGNFDIVHQIEEGEAAGRINWGLLRCRCFEFPIVDGVLLLSLAKGYGGSEEAIVPYVPLQVAAIEYIRAGDVTGLRGWIAKHIPLLHRLISPDSVDYLSFSTDLNRRLGPQVEKDLFAWNRYEVLGRRGALRHRRRFIDTFAATRIGSGVMRARRRLFPQAWSTFYVSRFVSNELASLRTRLRDIRFVGPILSLCCGHGPFELFLQGRHRTVPVVSVDGQLLNLFVVKRFIAPDSSYICHDLQFSLPFKDGAFSEVFSSTCLSEIPSQALFVRESLRVTSNAGWTMFDAVTPDVDGRIVPTRFYRVCQNHFELMEDYGKLMRECAGTRALHFTPMDPAEARWADDAAALAGVPSATFAFNGGRIDDMQLAGQRGFSVDEKALLAVNPRYRVDVKAEKLSGKLRLAERLATKLKMAVASRLPGDIEIDRRRLDDPAYLMGLYEAGVIVLLPRNFAREVVNLFQQAVGRPASA